MTVTRPKSPFFAENFDQQKAAVLSSTPMTNSFGKRKNTAVASNAAVIATGTATGFPKSTFDTALPPTSTAKTAAAVTASITTAAASATATSLTCMATSGATNGTIGTTTTTTSSGNISNSSIGTSGNGSSSYEPTAKAMMSKTRKEVLSAIIEGQRLVKIEKRGYLVEGTGVNDHFM
jgi:hypothetical protein